MPGTQAETPVPLPAPLADLPLSPHLAAELLPASGRGPASAPATDPAAPDQPAQGPAGRPTGTGSGTGSGTKWRNGRPGPAASSWLQSSRNYSRLLNRDGIVPLTARMAAGDLAFLAEAREHVLEFTELTLRLIDLHQPLDAGGITTDPTGPIRRCRSCMWRWPCPTFRILAEVVDRPPAG